MVRTYTPIQFSGHRNDLLSCDSADDDNLSTIIIVATSILTKCLRRIVNILCREQMANEYVLQIVKDMVGLNNQSCQNKERKLQRASLIRRSQKMPPDDSVIVGRYCIVAWTQSISKGLLWGTIEGKIKRGRHSEMWLDNDKSGK